MKVPIVTFNRNSQGEKSVSAPTVSSIPIPTLDREIVNSANTSPTPSQLQAMPRLFDFSHTRSLRQSKDYKAMLDEAYSLAIEQVRAEAKEEEKFVLEACCFKYTSFGVQNDIGAREALQRLRNDLLKSIRSLCEHSELSDKFIQHFSQTEKNYLIRKAAICNYSKIQSVALLNRESKKLTEGWYRNLYQDRQSYSSIFYRLCSDEKLTVSDVRKKFQEKISFIDKCLERGKANLKAMAQDESTNLGKWIQTVKQIASETRGLRHTSLEDDRYFANIIAMINFPAVYSIVQGSFKRDSEKEPSTEFIREIIKGLLSIPKEYINELAAKGFQVRLSKFMDDIYSGREGNSVQDDTNIPGAYNETRTSANDLTGFYTWRSVYMSELYRSNRLTHYYDEIANVVRHEVAHAVDHMHLDRSDLSKDPNFREAYLKDFAKLTDIQKRQFRYQIQLNTSTMEPRDMGYIEAFAELLADTWGGGCRPNQITEAFPNAAKWVQDNTIRGSFSKEISSEDSTTLDYELANLLFSTMESLKNYQNSLIFKGEFSADSITFLFPERQLQYYAARNKGQTYKKNDGELSQAVVKDHIVLINNTIDALANRFDVLAQSSEGRLNDIRGIMKRAKYSQDDSQYIYSQECSDLVPNMSKEEIAAIVDEISELPDYIQDEINFNGINETNNFRVIKVEEAVLSLVDSLLVVREGLQEILHEIKHNKKETQLPQGTDKIIAHIRNGHSSKTKNKTKDTEVKKPSLKIPEKLIEGYSILSDTLNTDLTEEIQKLIFKPDSNSGIHSYLNSLRNGLRDKSKLIGLTTLVS